MAPSASFAGFEHHSGASIVLLDLPVEGYPDLALRFTPEGLRATGFEMQGKSEALTVPDGEGLLARGTQSAHGTRFRKWVAIVRKQDTMAMVTVQVPSGRRDRSRRSRVRRRAALPNSKASD